MEQKDIAVLVGTLSPGHGNRMAAETCHRDLTEAGFETVLSISRITALPQELFQILITRFPTLSRHYREHSEKVRVSMGAKILGLLNSWSLLPTLMTRENPFRLGIFTQEYLLFGFSKEELHSHFPDGVFLVIPDVFPKENAIQIMKEKGIIPVVWNQEAFDYLKAQGLNPILCAPILPGATENKAKDLPPAGNHVFIKTSGSGIPNSYQRMLEQYMHQPHVEGALFAADHKTSYSQEAPVQEKADGTSFFSEALKNPPKVIIAYPSEVTQLVALLKSKGWTGTFICLPPRGQHEVKNLRWALSKGICEGVLGVDPKFEMESVPKISLSSIDQVGLSQNIIDLKLGTRTLEEVVRQHLHQKSELKEQVPA